jgi:DNA mismatch repair protein MutS
MAGVPPQVLARAHDLLKLLERTHSNDELSKMAKELGKGGGDDQFQLSFIQLDDPLLLQIRDDILNTDVDNLTPVEALNKLNEIRKLLGSKD